MSKLDLQAKALNPNTSLEELMALAEGYPNEVLCNPAFNLLLIEDPGIIAKMSGPAQLAILRQKNCPDHIRSNFRIGDLYISAYYNRDKLDCEFDYDDSSGARIKLQERCSGSVLNLLTLKPALLPYLLEALQDEESVNCRHSPYPMASALLTSVVHHTDFLAEIDQCLDDSDAHIEEPPDESWEINQLEIWPNAECDEKYYVTPNIDPLGNEEYIICNKDGDCCESSPVTERVRAVASAFIRDYDEIRNDYTECIIGYPELTFCKVEQVVLQCNTGSYSEKKVAISLEDLISLCDCLPLPRPGQIGVLVQFDEDSGLLEELDLPEELSKACDLEQLRSALAGQKDLEDKLVEHFTALGKRVLNYSSILGVTEASKIEVLIRNGDNAIHGLFGDIVCSDDDTDHNIIKGFTESKRYRVVDGEWIALGAMLKHLEVSREFRDSFLISILEVSNRGFEINMRMPAGISLVKYGLARKFSEAVGSRIRLTQCLPLTKNRNVCMYESHDNNEVYFGLLNDGFCNGMFSCVHHSLEGTIWEGLALSGT